MKLFMDGMKYLGNRLNEVRDDFNNRNDDVPVIFHIKDFEHLRKKITTPVVPTIVRIPGVDYSETDFAERCAQLPRGVGEEEYLAGMEDFD